MQCPACHAPNIDGARFCAKCGAPLPASAGPEDDPLIGAIVGGRYRITAILGEGGMGRVYTGEQQMGTSVRKVAVKTLLSQFAKDPQTVARFMRECGVVSELEHPNTIKVYDFGQTDSQELYIAMEFLTGGSLEDELERGQPLPPERVEKIMGQVCGSLQEAHDKGIVHRDLKPSNIHLTTRAGEADYVKVLDFGIAKRSEAADAKQEQKLTQQGTILGTPPYMSPEQFMGKELDSRSDIYSLGVLAYEMLTCRLPFEADTPWQWATQHMTAQPFPFETMPMAGNIPPKMRAAVMRALTKDRDQRQQTAREFFEELSIGASRASVVGLGAPSGGHRGSSPGTAVLSAPSGGPSGRAGGTQVGEPLFPDAMPAGAAPPPKTMVDASGPAPVMAPMPGHGVPTGGGQAVPAASAPKKSPMGMIIGVVAVLGVIGLVIGVVTMKKGSAEETDGPSIDLPDDDRADVSGKGNDKGDDDDDDDSDGDGDGDGDGSGGAAASGTDTGSETSTDTGGADTDTGTTTATTSATTTGTTTATNTATNTGSKAGADISGCCAQLKAGSLRKPSYKTAAGVCFAAAPRVKSGAQSKASAMASIRSAAGGSVPPGCN